jgi:hypothetical protein
MRVDGHRAVSHRVMWVDGHRAVSHRGMRVDARRAVSRRVMQADARRAAIRAAAHKVAAADRAEETVVEAAEAVAGPPISAADSRNLRLA